MVTKPFAFVVVAALVVLAAGTGAYLAVRQKRADRAQVRRFDDGGDL